MEISSYNLLAQSRAERNALISNTLGEFNKLNKSYLETSQQIAALSKAIFSIDEVTPDQMDEQIALRTKKIQLLTQQVDTVKQLITVRELFSTHVSLSDFVQKSNLADLPSTPPIRTIGDMLKDLQTAIKETNPHLFHRLLYELDQYLVQEKFSLYDLLVQKLGEKKAAEEIIINYLHNPAPSNEANTKIVNALHQIEAQYYPEQ